MSIAADPNLTKETTMFAVTARRAAVRRLARSFAAMAVAFAGLAVGASSAGAHAAHLDSRQFTYGDCTLTVGMHYWTHSAWANAYGQATCRSIKQYTRVTVTLKESGGREQSSESTLFRNSYGMGSRWLFAPWRSGCTFQAVMNVEIAGYAPTYVTTGAPVGICGRSSRADKSHGKGKRPATANRAPVAISPR